MRIVDLTEILTKKDSYVTTIKTPNLDPESKNETPYFVDEYVNLIDLLALPTVQLNMYPHWTECRMKNPTEDGAYLVTYAHDEYASGTEVFYKDRGWASVREIEAWAPMPPVYKKKKE